MSTMRPALRWMLAAVVGLSALALWWPDHLTNTVQVVAARELPPPSATANASLASPGPSGASPRVPAQLPIHTLERSDFDPFAGIQPAAPAPQPKPLAAPPPFVGPIYVPPPAPPAVNYRYLGQIVDPSGQRQVYLARPDKEVVVAVGTRLDEGYVVEALDTDGIRLVYPSLNAKAVIPIPTTQGGSPSGRSPASP